MSSHEEISPQALYRRIAKVGLLLLVAIILGGILGRWSVPDNLPPFAMLDEDATEVLEEGEEGNEGSIEEDFEPNNFHLNVTHENLSNAESVITQAHANGLRRVVLELKILQDTQAAIAQLDDWIKRFPDISYTLILDCAPGPDWFNSNSTDLFIDGDVQLPSLSSVHWQADCDTAIQALCKKLSAAEYTNKVQALVLDRLPIEMNDALAASALENGVPGSMPETLKSLHTQWRKDHPPNKLLPEVQANALSFEEHYATLLANANAALLTSIKATLPDMDVLMHYGTAQPPTWSVMPRAAQQLMDSDLAGFAAYYTPTLTAAPWAMPSMAMNAQEQNWLLLPRPGMAMEPGFLTSWTIGEAITHNLDLALNIDAEIMEDEMYWEEVRYLCSAIPPATMGEDGVVDEPDLLIVQPPGARIDFAAYAGVRTLVVTLQDFHDEKTPRAKLYCIPYDVPYTPMEIGKFHYRFQQEHANVIWYQATNAVPTPTAVATITVLPIDKIEQGNISQTLYDLQGIWLNKGENIVGVQPTGFKMVGTDFDSLASLGTTGQTLTGIKYIDSMEWTSIFVGLSPLPPLLLREILAIQEIPGVLRPNGTERYLDKALWQNGYLLVQADEHPGDRSTDFNGALFDVVDLFDPETGWGEVGNMTVHFEPDQTRLFSLGTL